MHVVRFDIEKLAVKNKKIIDKLQHDTTLVEFPTSERHRFGQFSRELRDVMLENLAEVLRSVPPSRDSWEWNAEQRDFAFDVVDELKTWVSDRWVHTLCTASFTCDPCKSITAEIVRLSYAITAWRDALVGVYKLQLRNIKETQGVDAMVAAVES